eukprot:CAMPEP_0173406666 /NCGR_PEP_ID=MMETSP1356-20130122/65126_1 /TAXON_ID=77927 ORGANISM="Hemiselmis virescens, Strain PCC157" /NCGR_SAMPLE_ID=MMETSP1356 /ASSEMBLY_ACC=CAM_ASM_000847 /LENGTH=48 /DNA_ID= /DNA_START= /DNA_END= /DNA_ORIENTATION=
MIARDQGGGGAGQEESDAAAADAAAAIVLRAGDAKAEGAKKRPAIEAQ